MTDGTNRRKLGQILVAKGVLSDLQLQHALAFQRLDGRQLGEILIELGIVSKADLERALDEQPGPADTSALRGIEHESPGGTAEGRLPPADVAFETRRRDLEVREAKVEAREQAVVEREERLDRREKELSLYVAQAQKELQRRADPGPPPPPAPAPEEPSADDAAPDTAGGFPFGGLGARAQPAAG